MPRYEPGSYKRKPARATAKAELCGSLLRLLSVVVVIAGFIPLPFAVLGRIDLAISLGALLSSFVSALVIWGFAEGLLLLARIAGRSEPHRSGD